MLSCLFWHVNLLIVDPDDNNLCFKFGMTLWTCFNFLVSYITASLWLINFCYDSSLFFRYFLNFKEPAQFFCVFFEVFRGFILLELEMISFLPLIFKLFLREVGCTHYLRMFSRFFFQSQALTVIRKSFLTNAAFNPVYSSCLLLVLSTAKRPISYCLFVFLESL